MSARLSWVIVAVMLSTLLPVAAAAQPYGGSQEMGTTYMGARLGAIIPQHDDLDGFDNGFAFELILGHRLTPNFAVEASVGRFSMNASVSAYDPAFGAVVSVDEDVSAVPVLVSAKLIAPVDNLELYGLVGAGLYFVTAEGTADLGAGMRYSASDDATSFGLHVGAGMAARLSPQLMLGLEGKYVIGSAKIWDSTNHFDSLLIGGSVNYSF